MPRPLLLVATFAALTVASCARRIGPQGGWSVRSASIEPPPIELFSGAPPAMRVLCVELTGHRTGGMPPPQELRLELDASLRVVNVDRAGVLIELQDVVGMVEPSAEPGGGSVRRFELDVASGRPETLRYGHRLRWDGTARAAAVLRIAWVDPGRGRLQMTYRVASSMSAHDHGETFAPPPGAGVRVRVATDVAHCWRDTQRSPTAVTAATDDVILLAGGPLPGPEGPGDVVGWLAAFP